MEKQSSLDRLQETIKQIRNMPPTAVERGFAAAINDISRRCVEEPWFGRPVFDVLYNQQHRTTGKASAGQRIEGEDRQLSEETDRRHDYSPDAFYGRNQGQEAEQQKSRERENDYGLER